MEKVIKPERSLYCPIVVSDLARSNAKVRQHSLREFSHSQDAAYRAFCRAPGRPQTAAFGRVYFETPLNHRSLSLPTSDSNLGDCVTASKAMVEGRSDTAVKDPYRSQPVYTERRQSKTARRTLRHSAGKSTEKEAARVSGSERSLEESFRIRNKEDSSDLIDLYSSSEERRYYSESSEETSKISSSLSGIVDRQLIVYYFVDAACSSTADVSRCGDVLLGCEAYDCGQQYSVSFYAVEIQGEGHQSTPGLGNCDSQENKALWDLLQKQLSLSRRQYSSDDNSHHQHLESLNVLISQLINVKPPNGYLYYFAYGPDVSTKRFTTHIHRKPEDTAWGLLYGFKLTSPDMQDCQLGSIWPKCKYSPQSAVEGRIYIISRQEADMLDRQMRLTQGLVTVLLPVWLMNSDENARSMAQHCLPAVVHLLPNELTDCKIRIR